MLKLSLFLSLSDEVLPVTCCDCRGVAPWKPALSECVRHSKSLTRYEKNLRAAEMQRLGLEE